MSAIVGIYYRGDREVELNQLTKMTDILAHRGSDGVDAWCEANVGLGHRMLFSTPESLHERLPFVDSTGDYVITADARIDNREELLSQLDFGEISPEKIADSQIILAAYKEWGDECPDKLLGDFAFAIWDKPQQQLFCARDHFGVKPFYYYDSSEIFSFATEIKAIFTQSEIPREINEVRIGDYLASLFHDKEITSYIDVLRLPPASWLKVNAEGKEIQTYWTLDPNREIMMDSDEEYAAKFREIFTEAVRCRLRSAYQVGTTLSGGLDSSSITCVARNLLQEQQAPPLHTFSGVFEKLEECDERKYINPIIEQEGLKPHFINCDNINPFDELDRVMWHQDEAFFAPHWFMSWKIYGEVKKEGVRIILDGFDGDTTVSHGLGYLNELAEAGKWLKFARQTKAYTDINRGSFTKLFWRYFRHHGIKPIIDIDKYSPLNIVKYFNRFFYPPNKSVSEVPPKTADIVNHKFASRIELSKRILAWRKVKPYMGQEEKARHYNNISSGLCSLALEEMDKFMAARSIEPRYPFWDKRLVEYCLSLPTEQKLNLGWNRVVMRRGMNDTIPEIVRWRASKTDFSPSLINGLRLLDDKCFSRTIEINKVVLQKYIDIEYAEAVYEEFISKDCENANDKAKKFWLIFALASWLNPKVVSRTREVSAC